MNTALRRLVDLVNSASERFSTFGPLKDFHYDETPLDLGRNLKLIAMKIQEEMKISDEDFGQLVFIFHGLSAWMDFVGDRDFQTTMLKQLQVIDENLLDGNSFDRQLIRLYGAEAIKG